VELAAIAEVSVAMVFDAAVVSAAPLSYLPQAATARAATARVVTLSLDTTIVGPPPKGQDKTAPFIEAALVVLSGITAKTVHTAFVFLLRSGTDTCRRTHLIAYGAVLIPILYYVPSSLA